MQAVNLQDYLKCLKNTREELLELVSCLQDKVNRLQLISSPAFLTSIKDLSQEECERLLLEALQKK